MEVGDICPRCFSCNTGRIACQAGGPEDGVDHLHQVCLDCGFNVVVPLLPLDMVLDVSLDMALDTENN